MADELNSELEREHREQVRELAYNAFQELCETLRPSYRPKTLGYTSIEHARQTIIEHTDRVISRLSAAHLRRTAGKTTGGEDA